LHPAVGLDGESAVAVELQLAKPLRAFRQPLSALKQHGLDESRSDGRESSLSINESAY
jgi:hypothetical protein